jgi:hypothetical protein
MGHPFFQGASMVRLRYYERENLRHY